jgi:hypothetical protein
MPDTPDTVGSNDPPRHSMLHTLNGLLFAASLFLVAGGLWLRDRLPPPTAVLAASLSEPTQVAGRRAPFGVSRGGVDYTVSPLYTYELRGMVVSRHDTSVWWNPTHRNWWKDHLNVADLCIVWGDNLKSGIYRELSYTSGSFTCYVATKDSQTWSRFDSTGLSNNHLLTASPATAKLLRSVRPGDQVVVKGWLAEYAHDAGMPFRRGTSVRRDDTGNGACETIWVEEAAVLARANRGWRSAVPLGAIGASLALLFWFFLPARLER